MQVFIENNVYVISTQKTKTKHIMLPIPLNHKYSNILMDVLCDYCNLSFHPSCLSPPLDKIPKVEYLNK